ncbi:hypothetical protein [Flavobacterium sp.]|uniref:hypothetical protein n=1 Tax=Flavobacterium sp. TaxID=239 RepID=UPI002FDE5333
MKIQNLLILCFLFLITSCSQNTVYSRFDTLDESHQWAQTNTKSYDFTIDDEAAHYNVLFKFSHVYGYPMTSVPLHFSFKNPDGKTEDFTFDLALKDLEGQELGDCVGDICDLDSVVKENLKLSKGKYTVTVSHRYDGPYLPNVLGVGLEITKSEP